MLTRFPDGALCGTALIGHRFVLRQRAVEPTPVDRTSANRNRLNDRFAQSREAAWGRTRSLNGICVTSIGHCLIDRVCARTPKPLSDPLPPASFEALGSKCGDISLEVEKCPLCIVVSCGMLCEWSNGSSHRRSEVHSERAF